ncbi:aldose epimerase family protein [uncultured Winogradskyella sp.]|uniref:aldose epimerase family protein n=1 Tax=uncultured Winogradskyella sp. TaxID=395353 RepID=UPI0035187806
MTDSDILTLSNANGITLELSTLGATITQLLVPNKNGKPINVVATLENQRDYSSKSYLKERLYLGSTVGRYAGRISKGFFEIDNIKYPLYNLNGVHLHGGKKGFDQKLWSVQHHSKNSAVLTCFSPHMEEGYPGNLKVSLTYTITESNELKLHYVAETDRTTHVNLTNHSYFNLNGEGTILNHKLKILSDEYLEVDNRLIPTGQILQVKHSRYDYTHLKTIDQPSFIGLDDTFITRNDRLKAILKSESSGIEMHVYSDQPAMVVFTPPEFPNFNFKNATVYSKFPAICFETQHFPDSPHHEHFPSTLLQPGDIYRQETSFAFKID